MILRGGDFGYVAQDPGYTAEVTRVNRGFFALPTQFIHNARRYVKLEGPLFNVRHEHPAFLASESDFDYWEDVDGAKHNRIILRGTPDDNPQAWRGHSLETQEATTWKQFENNLLQCNEDWEAGCYRDRVY